MSIMMKFKQTINHFILNLLGRILPDHTKRLMLIASLAACPHHTRFHKPAITKLNEIMELSGQDEALLLPIHLSRVIWRGERGERVLYSLEQSSQCETSESLIDQLMAEIPSWLKYDGLRELREDIKKLLSNQNQLMA